MTQKNKKTSDFRAYYICWWIYTLVARIYVFFIGCAKRITNVFKKRNKKEGCIVLYNHTSNKDHFITTASFNYTRVNYVITKHFYYNKTLKTLLKVVKTIPREQFKADLISIKAIKKAVDDGRVICLAPEGQITIHGKLQYIDPAVVKLIRLCKCSVYTSQIKGGYFAFPKWRKSKRKYPVSNEIIKVFDKEELSSLTDEEIYNRVVESLDVKDFENQKKNPIKIKSKAIIKGLDNILYYCPKCKSKYTTETDGNIMTCTKCNNKVRMNEYGFLEPVGPETVMFESEYEWYKYEKELIKKDILKGNFHLEAECELHIGNEETWKINYAGTGKVVLTNTELYYEGTINGEKVRKDFALEKMIQLPFDPAFRFDIPCDEGKFEFRPIDNPKVVIEFVQAIDAFREIRLG